MATVCKNVLDKLRVFEEYRDVHVFYHKFTTAEEDLCINNEIKLINTDLTLVPKYSYKILQTMVQCFTRPPMIKFGQKPGIFKYFHNIFVYPSSSLHISTSWLVFEGDQNRGNFVFLKTWLIINDLESDLIPFHLLFLPPRTYINNKIEIFNDLYPFINIWKNAVL